MLAAQLEGHILENDSQSSEFAACCEADVAAAVLLTPCTGLCTGSAHKVAHAIAHCSHHIKTGPVLLYKHWQAALGVPTRNLAQFHKHAAYAAGKP